MSTITTLGCKPTLGEAMAYYRRPDILQFLLDTSRVRPVVLPPSSRSSAAWLATPIPRSVR